ncbi:DUF4328 domain-containing protein [Streptomyces sp. P9(2023)]|uniref:DUF4328 domain-containing protein n=1 Tax=Streptomyces sp. P9(2023) TaxID=3064394 RepID=UPI0028F42D8E|nr:DUF4328 domain-containing protein [Streptomyces sp. P9(2023)]MDT9688772.1 DUF4328 domain-containing protein [Streptomyces sp. P9(2023)]
MLRNPNGLSYAVVCLLGGNIALDVLQALFEVRALVSDDVAVTYDPAVFGALDLNVVYSVAFTLYVATAIVFIIWFHRLRANAAVWAGDLQSRGPGWAIGGWFIPIANLWIPRGIAADIWRASRWEPYAADGKRELTLLNSWWTLWVLDVVVDRVAAQLYKRADNVDAYVTAAQVSLLGYVLDIAAAVLAILFVRRLTSMQHRKATGMIPAA